jgi:ABC-type oligopeptide transport system ATPase subunit
MPILEVSRLRASHATENRTSRSRIVLNDVSFAIDRGQSFGLLGESGSGKSTVARCIAGLSKPDAGSISFDGMNISLKRGTGEGWRFRCCFKNHTAHSIRS